MGNVVLILANHRSLINLTSWSGSLWFAAKRVVFLLQLFCCVSPGMVPLLYEPHVRHEVMNPQSHWMKPPSLITVRSAAVATHHCKKKLNITRYIFPNRHWFSFLSWKLHKNCIVTSVDADNLWDVKQCVYSVRSRCKAPPGWLCVVISASCNSAAGMSKWSDSGGDLGGGLLDLISKRGPRVMWQTSKRSSCCVLLHDLIDMSTCVCVLSRGTSLLSPVWVSVMNQVSVNIYML